MTRAHSGATDGNATEAMRAAAEGGDPAAQLDLANRYYFGKGLERDVEAAYRWMRRAAEAGVAEAQSKVGYFLTCGLGVPADPKGALRWFLRGVRGGYPKAAYNLGDAFWKGLHVTRSPRRAWFFFSKAVELGQEAGHFGLAALCYAGLGVPRDPEKALEHLRREACAVPLPPPGLDAVREELDRRQAIGREPDPPELDDAGFAALREEAGTGDAEAGYRLGRFLLRKARRAGPEALAALLGAAGAGHAAAAFQAGPLLYQGWGVPKDVPRALVLLETSARAGNADAARFLALAYDGLRGNVPKDADVAMRWWNEAARLGDPHASWFVGQLLLEEDPTPEGQTRGLELIAHAAGRGFPKACGYLGWREAQELFLSADLFEEVAFPLLRLGAIRGDDDAAARMLGEVYALGLLARGFLRGIGVPRDVRLAIRLAERAADEGGALGSHLLALLLLRGEGIAPDPARARRLFVNAAGNEHLPSLFTTLEEEAIRYRRAGAWSPDLPARVEELASDPGSLPATTALDGGLLIWNGDAGLLQDDALAIELFRAAARKGDALAAACLSHALRVSGEAEEEMEWLETAARSGLAGAQRHLAFRLVGNRSATWDDARVVQLLESAADQGDPFACVELARILERAEKSGAPADGLRAGRIEALRRCALEAGYPAEAMRED